MSRYTYLGVNGSILVIDTQPRPAEIVCSVKLVPNAVGIVAALNVTPINPPCPTMPVCEEP